MAGSVFTYDVNAINLSIAGILIEQGGGDDGFFSIDLPQGFDAKTGVHGDVVTYKMGAEVAEATLKLLDPSPINETLFALYQADKLSETGEGVGDFLMEDLNSAMEISGQCRVVKPPNIDKQSEAQSFEWTIQVFQAVVNFRPREATV